MVDVYVKCSQPAPIRFSRRRVVCGGRQRRTPACTFLSPTQREPPHVGTRTPANLRAALHGRLRGGVAAAPDAEGVVEDLRKRSCVIYAHHARRARPSRRAAIASGRRLVCSESGFQLEETAPVFVIIHGGSWQWRTKEDFACVAMGRLSAEMHVVIAEYTLAPQARMSAIVAEIAGLLDALRLHPVPGVRTGRAPRVVLAGHSAGRHLTAMHRSHPTVAGVLAISGVFALDPIARGALNETLQLGNAGVVACSPKRHIARGAPTCIAVGGNGIAGIAAPEPTLCHRLTCCGRARGSARRPSAKSLTSTSWRNWKAPRAVWLRRLSAYPIETREGLHNQRRNAS